MLHVQKLESLGVLAGGIAHDFNNILSAIIGNNELALRQIDPCSPVAEKLKKVGQSAQRATDLARQMLAYSGRGKFLVAAIDLNSLIEEMRQILEVSISKNAELVLHLKRPLPTVEADATQIHQIVMNLVINASEAIGDINGVITITTGTLECTSEYLKNIWHIDDLETGVFVFIEVSDTGCGMDKETQSRIFDPFFTTKFTGRGLGMAAVQGIVRGHKGGITVYSEPDAGSTFKVLLPACGKPVEQVAASVDDIAWKGEGVVLFVDDEEAVRDIGQEMLQELGYEAVTAADGREAVEIFKSRNNISFVILDLTMPHMDGEQCFRELRQIDPNVRVIMSSGFSEQEVTQKFIGKGLAGFIQKPYRLSAIRDAVKNVNRI
jgi:CheY-like chemotaxis protein